MLFSYPFQLLLRSLLGRSTILYVCLNVKAPKKNVRIDLLQFFIQFLNNMAEGKVAIPNNGKMTLTDTFLFYTGSRYLPINYCISKYHFGFNLNDSRNRYRPTCNTCEGWAHLRLIIPIVEFYEDMRGVCSDAILSIATGFTMA